MGSGRRGITVLLAPPGQTKSGNLFVFFFVIYQECTRPAGRIVGQYTGTAVGINNTALLYETCCCLPGSAGKVPRCLFGAFFLDLVASFTTRWPWTGVLGDPCRRLIIYPGSVWKAQVRVGSGQRRITDGAKRDQG